MRKKTIAYWMRTFGYKIDLYNVHTNKLGRCSLFASCIGPDGSEHTFDV
jgi:hypothetical protein